MDFIIDTHGQSDLAEKNRLLDSDDDDDLDIEDTGLDTTKIKLIKDKDPVKKRKAGKNDIDLKEFERDMGWTSARKKTKVDKAVKIIANDLTPVDKILKKSQVKAGFERLRKVPKYDESEKKLKTLRKRRRERTKGKDWFNLPAPEMTDEIRHDLEVIQMRSVLDPKRFYKKNDLKVLPKYFHIGKVMDSPLDFYNNRMTKKERKRTIVDELMADAEFSKFNKRKYKEIIDEKKKLQYKAHKHAKKLKKKGKNK